jgi:hypothetical protein
MPIQRSIKSPRYNDYQYSMYNRSNNPANIQSQETVLDQEQLSSPREVENINEIRKLIREQSNLNLNVVRHRSSNSDSSDDLEVPVRKFTPLPDIPRSEDAYFRTESRLVKGKEHILSKENSFIDDKSVINYINNSVDDITENSKHIENIYAKNYNSNRKFKKETRYHFGTSSSQNKINLCYRLPALEKQISHSLQNTMDLDEDLPMNPVSENTQNQRQIYTSPGDRIISPVKRPQVIFICTLSLNKIEVNSNNLLNIICYSAKKTILILGMEPRKRKVI